MIFSFFERNAQSDTMSILNVTLEIVLILCAKADWDYFVAYINGHNCKLKLFDTFQLMWAEFIQVLGYPAKSAEVYRTKSFKTRLKWLVMIYRKWSPCIDVSTKLTSTESDKLFFIKLKYIPRGLYFDFWHTHYYFQSKLLMPPVLYTVGF